MCMKREKPSFYIHYDLYNMKNKFGTSSRRGFLLEQHCDSFLSVVASVANLWCHDFCYVTEETTWRNLCNSKNMLVIYTVCK